MSDLEKVARVLEGLEAGWRAEDHAGASVFAARNAVHGDKTFADLANEACRLAEVVRNAARADANGEAAAAYGTQLYDIHKLITRRYPEFGDDVVDAVRAMAEDLDAHRHVKEEIRALVPGMAGTAADVVRGLIEKRDALAADCNALIAERNRILSERNANAVEVERLRGEMLRHEKAVEDIVAEAIGQAVVGSGLKGTPPLVADLAACALALIDAGYTVSRG